MKIDPAYFRPTEVPFLLGDASTVAYLVTSPFSPTDEFEINPLDPEIGIE